MADATQAAPLSNLDSPSQRQEMAPLWHTTLLVVILLGLSFASYYSSRHYASQSSDEATPSSAARIVTYAFTLVQEWLLFLFVLWGERLRSSATVRDRVGIRVEKDAVIRDIGIAALVWGLVAIINGILGFLLHPTGARVVLKLVPHTLPELALWIPLCASAGFCEEYIFRGYFQRQFGFLTGSIWAGVVIQAVLFGAAHGYQGAKQMLVIFCMGLTFGIAANLRKSLRPVMFAHGWTDFFAGAVGYIVNAMHIKIPV
ncbi:MAG TPA: type II CAAX endopeptidase family protein [Candidatus Acidoferrales bacterium]|nr:type II CAAX endopeptidase family protein [Candidatus Acidoferrales bacterium]